MDQRVDLSLCERDDERLPLELVQSYQARALIKGY